MTDTVAAQQLRAFLERIERLQEERKTIGDDIAEVFKELEGTGFDKFAAKVVLKIRAAGIEEYHERTAQIDLYLGALGMLPAPAGAPVRENIEKIAASEVARIEQTIAGAGGIGAAISAALGVEVEVVRHVDTAPDDFEPPAFLRQDKPLRPHCRKPDDCAGYGKTHCHVCLNQAEELAA